jgi:hypothetical protein
MFPRVVNIDILRHGTPGLYKIGCFYPPILLGSSFQRSLKASPSFNIIEHHSGNIADVDRFIFHPTYMKDKCGCSCVTVVYEAEVGVTSNQDSWVSTGYNSEY